MNDQYLEILVKREQASYLELLKKAVLAAMAVSLILGILFLFPLFFVVTILLGLFYYFKVLRMDVEYEYFYMDGEFVITKILNKSRRKNFMTIPEGMVELIAPLESMEVENFGNPKVVDCSAQNPEEVPYVMICRHNHETKKVLLQLNSEAVKFLKRSMPGKVRLY